MIKYHLPEGQPDLSRATEGSSGYDLRALVGLEREIYAGQRWKISTGLRLEMPRGIEAQVRSRSGLAMNHGIVVLGGTCTIDSDYRGEVFVMLINHGTEPYRIKSGDRIAQLVFAPILPAHEFLVAHSAEPLRVAADRLSSTDRGHSGFGSSGR